MRPISPNAARPSRNRRRRAPPRRSRARCRGRPRARRSGRRRRRSRTRPPPPSGSPACRASTATIIASRFGSTPVATRRGIARSVGATSDWISISSGRVPSSTQVTAAPTSPGSLRPKSAEGSGTPTSPVAGHLEDGELVRRAEPVLRRAQHPVGVVAVALELEHAVDEMLEHARARDRAVLRDVADEERRDARAPSPTRRSRAAASRTCATEPGAEPMLGGVERLHGVDHADRRAARARASRRRRRARSPRGSRPPRRRRAAPRAGLTCATDSSPVTSSTRRSRLIARSADRSSVDFPTPGSPPTRTSEAGTRPPPSTRSSSPTPVGIRAVSSASTSTSRSGGRAAEAATPAQPAPPPRPSSRTRRSRGTVRATARTSSRTRCTGVEELAPWP